MIPDSLKMHQFLHKAWDEAVQLQRMVEEQGGGEDEEDVDEYQFYVMRVGYCLAQIMTWVEQLDHAVYYLSDFSYKKQAQEEGINRAKHLIYNVENYLIRLHSVYDRALQLTNSVFHLGVSEESVGHSVIISNMKVAKTDVKKLLKNLKKECEKRAQERHAIVHRESHREDQLRRLELFYMFDRETWEQRKDNTSFDGLAHIRTQLMKDVVAEKKKEFSELNISIFEALENLFDGLHQQYLKERNRLHLYVYGKPA